MRDRLAWAADRLRLGAAQAAARMARLAFATLPVSGLSDVGANFLPYLLDHWCSPRKVLAAAAGAGAPPRPLAPPRACQRLPAPCVLARGRVRGSGPALKRSWWQGCCLNPESKRACTCTMCSVCAWA
jgi:hypothetical protein